MNKEVIENAIFTVTSETEVNELTIVNYSDSVLHFSVELKDVENNICADIKLSVAAKSTKRLLPSNLTSSILDAFENDNYSFTGEDLIVAVERPSEATDFSLYFDDDGMKSVGGENCAVYIFNESNDVRYNQEELLAIYNKANSLADYLDILLHTDTPSDFPYETIKDCMEDFDLPYSQEKEKELCAWVEEKSFGKINETDILAEYLSITTSKPWETLSFTGYSQGDYCTVLYCSEVYSKESITEIGKLWLGSGFEYEIDGEIGYYVTDDIQWGDREKLRKTLADYYGCEARNLVIREYVNTVQQYLYKNV